MWNDFNFFLLKGHVNHVGNIENNYFLYFCQHWSISDFFFFFFFFDFPKSKCYLWFLLQVKTKTGITRYDIPLDFGKESVVLRKRDHN